MRVEDFGDFIFGVRVDDDWGFGDLDSVMDSVRDLDSVRELVQSGGF